MNATTYNGWSNYATWRVNLELCDDILNNLDDVERNSYANSETGRADLANHLKESCEYFVTDGIESGHMRDPHSTLAVQYAMAFLDQVNWREIADNFIG